MIVNILFVIVLTSHVKLISSLIHFNQDMTAPLSHYFMYNSYLTGKWKSTVILVMFPLLNDMLVLHDILLTSQHNAKWFYVDFHAAIVIHKII